MFEVITAAGYGRTFDTIFQAFDYSQSLALRGYIAFVYRGEELIRKYAPSADPTNPVVVS